MINNLKELLRDILRSPKTSIGIGITLVITGICEASETIMEDFLGMEIGVHHGLIFFGTIKVLEAMLDVLEGTESLVIAEIEET